MAQAKSFIKLRGSMGETTFKKRGKKNFANDKVVISDERMKHHYKFERLRLNGKQMGNASKSAMVLRDAFNGIIHQCKDSRMVGRFNAELMKVVKQDSSHGAAERGKVARAENMEILRGFDFNNNARLRATFNVAFNTEVNRETGEAKIHIASFKPASAVKAPRLATQFRIMAQVAQIDFDPAVDFTQKSHPISAYYSGPVLLDNTPTEPVSITFNIKTGNVHTILIALGVDFIDSSNPLYATTGLGLRVNSACIVAVDAGLTVPFIGQVLNDNVNNSRKL